MSSSSWRKDISPLAKLFMYGVLSRSVTSAARADRPARMNAATAKSAFIESDEPICASLKYGRTSSNDVSGLEPM